LSSEAFLYEYNDWANRQAVWANAEEVSTAAAQAAENDKEPFANLQYWVNQFLTPLPQNEADINPRRWYYQVKMNWEGYSYCK